LPLPLPCSEDQMWLVQCVLSHGKGIGWEAIKMDRERKDTAPVKWWAECRGQQRRPDRS